MKVAVVDSPTRAHGVQPVLQVFETTPAQIAPSTYYATKTRGGLPPDLGHGVYAAAASVAGAAVVRS